MLALLAVGRERGLSRDKIVGYLWSESPAARARHLLSESLYVFRKSLGDESIRLSGDDVRLDDQVVTSDVGDFEMAMARGDPEKALALYKGHFLDGFFMRRAIDFERWVERESDRLRRLALEAAWQMTQRSQAAGAIEEAVKWARCAVPLSGGDEVAVRQLIELLARSGDRHDALRVYQELVRELHEEYGLEPTPETQRVIERIRGEAG